MSSLVPLPRRPKFPKGRLFYQTAAVALAVIALVEFFGTPKHLRQKVELFVGIVILSALITVAPFCRRFAVYLWRAAALLESVPDRLRTERDNTWIAVETNAVFADGDISILRMRLVDERVSAYLSVGSLQGVKVGQQFEIVAVPDMERYGVVTAADVSEETCWAELHPTEGQTSFGDQMRARLKSGELQAPAGYEVRPYMFEAYRRVLTYINEAAKNGGTQTTFTEGKHERT